MSRGINTTFFVQDAEKSEPPGTLPDGSALFSFPVALSRDSSLLSRHDDTLDDKEQAEHRGDRDAGPPRLVESGGGDDVLDRLQHGLADLTLVATPYNTEFFEGFPVAREPWTAIMSIHHPLAQEKGDFIPLKKLVGQPLFIPSRRSRAEAVRAWFREIGEEPVIAGELSNYIDAVALAEQGVGICIFPMTTYNDSDLVVKKVITESERQIEYVLLWNRNQQQKELAQEFVNFVRDCLEEEQKGTVPYIVPEKEYFPPENTPLLSPPA